MSTILKRTHMCGTLNVENVNQEVVLNGWVAKRRNLGGLIFVDLRDKTGIVQVTFDDKIPQELFEKADALRSEYVIGVKGIVKSGVSKLLGSFKRKKREERKHSDGRNRSICNGYGSLFRSGYTADIH